MKITVGYWSHDSHVQEIRKEFNNFVAVFMFLAPFIRDESKGFYSVSFSID